jgi:protein required for attachment to host cells
MGSDIVMICDQSRARFFLRGNLSDTFLEVSDFINTREALRPGQMHTSEPGAMSAPAGHLSRKMPSENSGYRHGWEVFARALMKTLGDYVGDDHWARIYIVAPPRFVGVLRQMMTDKVRDHLVREIHHNITMLNTGVIRKMLPDYIQRENTHGRGAFQL